jgi:L-iditol 2-dehydrogenase
VNDNGIVIIPIWTTKGLGIMKTLRLYDRYKMHLCDEPLPTPGPDEDLLKVRAVGICGSDILWYSTAGIGGVQLHQPIIPGHEFMGVTSDGTRVAVEPAIPCMKCEYCLRGDPNLCPSVKFSGHEDLDGSLREYMNWPRANLFPIPDTISDGEGAMLEPLGVAIHTLNLSHIKFGQSVGIFGCGPIGLLLIQLARLAGASQIIATDPLQHRVEAARNFGADLAVQVDKASDNSDLIKHLKNEFGLDICFDASGSAGAVATAFNLAGPGASIILAGIPEDNQTGFSASIARRKGLTIKLVRRMKHTYPQSIELVKSGRVDVKSIISHHFPLEQAQLAFETAVRRDGLKVIIDI